MTLYDEAGIDPRLIEFQREVVLRYLPEGMEFLQLEMRRVREELDLPAWSKSAPDADSSDCHALCLDRCLYSLPYDHFIVLDCDAVPLGRRFFDFMLGNPDWLVGAAHAANHLSDDVRYLPYVSPSAMSIAKRTYCDLAQSFSPWKGESRLDTGAWVTIAAQWRGIPNVLIYPNETLFRQWRVGWQDYGFVTAYGDLLCHMWASRAVGTLVFEFYRDYVRLREAERAAGTSLEPGPTAVADEDAVMAEGAA